ncbi:MAG: 2-hydroxyacyl-CoA dehydratase [Desulfobacterales bacterium]|nr:2-hydroxyacyl-CoA dehydratase [Desulfobacterales bacterium]
MILQHFENQESGIMNAIRENPESASPRKKLALETARLGKRLYSNTDDLVWAGPLIPFDLLNAMDVTPAFAEFIASILVSTDAGPLFFENAEQAGYASDTCGYHRMLMGSALKGMIPTPKLLISAMSPCTGGLAAMENLARVFKKDLFILHIPQKESDHGVRILADHIRDMAESVSSHTGKVLDNDRLRKAMENTNKTREILSDIYTLAQQVPSPVNGRDLSNFGIVLPLFFGTEVGIEIAQAFYDELKSRIKANRSGVPGERIRLMWLQNRIQFKNNLVKMLEKEFNASIVVDELNVITWDPIDPEDPYIGLARRSISSPLNGTVERRVKQIVKLAEAYKIDGAINPCHWGCRQGTGARGLIDSRMKEIGVPVLNLEVDCVDPRNFAEGQLITRIEAFMEMIESRPSPW